jgi:hypothetical protein
MPHTHSRSVAGGYLGNSDPTEINGPILVYSSVIQKVMMASIGEAVYAAAFHTGQMASGLRKILSDLGYPQQPPTYILVDNKVAHGIPAIPSSLNVQRALICNIIGYAIAFIYKSSS